jgi:methionyl-tRNA formyltransferase
VAEAESGRRDHRLEHRAHFLFDWRAQTSPYPGAFSYLGDERIVVWPARAAALEQAAPP